MKHAFTFLLLVISIICVSHAAPLANTTDTSRDSQSAFGQAFDEIVVESHLTVRRKSNPRQGRTENSTKPGIIKAKRETVQSLRKPFTSSASSAQAQGFNSFGPLGSFGASATSSQSQNFNGFIGSAAFSGTQQYTFNGKTIDIAFGNSLTGKGPVITVMEPNGRKKPFKG